MVVMRLKIRRGHAPGHRGTWRREAVEFGALFIAAGIAHVFSTALGHRESGSVILISLGVALCALVAAHLWWAHRRSRPRDVIASPPARLWRVRAQVRDTPGQLAALAAAIAAAGGNIMSLNSQSDLGGTVDELYVRMPAPIPAETLVRALTSAGGREVSVLPATMHQLVDPITRALLLASSVGADPRRLPAALAAMLDAHPLPAGRARSRETLLLAPATGRPIRLHRPGLPFTATETARALVMLELARRLDDPCPT
ncbi:hypothetical protein Airi01_062850 [Actinoallomurus iriomotensis]|uniref:ACT domain-containing protein n=2 Tax=Actinoallomurus iriomotensis TaxID=478107 RepID=A0A9W6RLS1_9ACTN|nr:hypothetical protein Airi01_062850 [Actinoallomurus iriomotensis]